MGRNFRRSLVTKKGQTKQPHTVRVTITTIKKETQLQQKFKTPLSSNINEGRKK